MIRDPDRGSGRKSLPGGCEKKMRMVFISLRMEAVYRYKDQLRPSGGPCTPFAFSTN